MNRIEVPSPCHVLALGLMLAGCAVPMTDRGVGAEGEGDVGRKQVGVWQGDVGSADLPSLCTKYSELTIVGDVELRDTDYQDLTPLGCVVEVIGSVTLVDNHQLTSLTGLHHLQRANSIILVNNDALLDLSGLDSLQKATLLFLVANGVERLEGLTQLRELQSLVVSENRALVSLKLGGAVKDVSSVMIMSNERLTDLTGLDLESANWLTISDNAGLESLRGLEALVHVGVSLTVTNNASLVALDGLESLMDVACVDCNFDNELVIDDNPALVDVTALNGLEEVTDAVSIRNNVTLTDQAARDLVETFERVGTVRISGNG